MSATVPRIKPRDTCTQNALASTGAGHASVPQSLCPHRKVLIRGHHTYPFGIFLDSPRYALTRGMRTHAPVELTRRPPVPIRQLRSSLGLSYTRASCGWRGCGREATSRLQRPCAVAMPTWHSNALLGIRNVFPPITMWHIDRRTHARQEQHGGGAPASQGCSARRRAPRIGSTCRHTPSPARGAPSSRPSGAAPPRGRGARTDFRGRSRAALGRRARNAVRAERRRRRQWRAARRRRAESHGRRRSSPRHWPRCWSFARPAITMVAAVERSLPRRRRLSSQTTAMQAHRRQ